MPDYSKGKIYTIRFHNSNEIYIGSTTQPLANRFGLHKKPYNCSLYHLINNKYNGEWSNCYIELYENYSCNNREELCKKEGEIIRLFKNDNNYNLINTSIAGRTRQEYRQDNKEILYKEAKEYKLNHKEKFLEIKKEFYHNNKDKINEKIDCECGCNIFKRGLKRHLQTKKHQEYLKVSIPEQNASEIVC